MQAPHVPPPAITDHNGRQTINDERLERTALVLIVLVVGALAGRASFSHVVDWSMRNLPDGTERSYGYTNAMVSELVPGGVLLFVRFQRRQGRQPGALAWSMLVGAGLFSVTAQLAVAKPNPSGWLVASVPTLAFMALTKLLLSMKPVHTDRQREAALASLPEPSPALQTSIKGDRLSARVAAATSGATSSPAPTAKRVTAKSLTHAARVAAAVTELGADAKPAQIAARAGVSESTARRHLPKRVVASPSGHLPGDMAMEGGGNRWPSEPVGDLAHTRTAPVVPADDRPVMFATRQAVSTGRMVEAGAS